MRADFEAAAQIVHHGSRGTARENTLRQFLAEGRLPEKYGLGAGEIVGRVRDTSRQCDLIIYDKLNGVTLLYDEAVKVFPIDCIYGIVEVKSALSKAEFLDALEKIRTFKQMAPGGAVSHSIGGGLTMVHARPRPFGVVFAYSLANNSLNSLVENLRAWEKTTPPAFWPNYVCVLEAGTIYHHGKPFENCLDSDQITEAAWPIAIHHREDSLFQFYCSLHDMCAHMNLGPVELMPYYDPAVRIGRFVVDGRGFEGEGVKDGVMTGKKVRITEAAIEKIVAWCSTQGPTPYGEMLKKRLGSIPLGMEDAPSLNREVFLYNPDNLPGLHEIGPSPFTVTAAGAFTNTPSLVNAVELMIDGQLYVVAMSGFKEDDFEEVDP